LVEVKALMTFTFFQAELTIGEKDCLIKDCYSKRLIGILFWLFVLEQLNPTSVVNISLPFLLNQSTFTFYFYLVRLIIIIQRNLKVNFHDKLQNIQASGKKINKYGNSKEKLEDNEASMMQDYSIIFAMIPTQTKLAVLLISTYIVE
jgi:hypothetical protein